MNFPEIFGLNATREPLSGAFYFSKSKNVHLRRDLLMALYIYKDFSASNVILVPF